MRALALLILLASGCKQEEVTCPPDELEHLVLKEWSGIIRFSDGKQAPLTVRFKTKKCKTTAELAFPDGMQLDATYFDHTPEGITIEFPMSFNIEDMMSKGGKLILRGPVPEGEWRGKFEYSAESGPITLAPGDLDTALPALERKYGKPGQAGANFW